MARIIEYSRTPKSLFRCHNEMVGEVVLDSNIESKI